MKQTKIKEDGWVELVDRKEDFQKILRVLIEFDERTRRFQRFDEPETHYMRKALSVANPEMLRIFTRHLGAFVYYVVAQFSGPNGNLNTSWVHEDGVQEERDEFRDNAEHPVHKLLCLSDLFYEASELVPEDLALLCVDDGTLSLMTEEIVTPGQGELGVDLTRISDSA